MQQEMMSAALLSWRFRSVLSLLSLIGISGLAVGQAAPSGLIGCNDPQTGTLFNVMPSGTPREECPTGTEMVNLGSISNINVGDSLTSKVEGGDAFIDIAPNLAVPPSCPAGQIAVADGEGGWVCTPPQFGRANPGSRVWIVPKLDRCVHTEGSDGFRPRAPLICGESRAYSEIYMVNPGNDTASVSCWFFSRNGSPQIDFIRSVSIPSGGQMSCSSPGLESGSTRDYAWALIVSDQDILLTARTVWSHYLPSLTSAQVEAYPVNCDDPEGYEFVCQFASN